MEEFYSLSSCEGPPQAQWGKRWGGADVLPCKDRLPYFPPTQTMPHCQRWKSRDILGFLPFLSSIFEGKVTVLLQTEVVGRNKQQAWPWHDSPEPGCLLSGASPVVPMPTSPSSWDLACSALKMSFLPLFPRPPFISKLFLFQKQMPTAQKPFWVKEFFPWRPLLKPLEPSKAFCIVKRTLACK